MVDNLFDSSLISNFNGSNSNSVNSLYNSSNSNSSLSNSSSIQFISNNSSFSNIFNQILFMLSETEIPKYFEDRKEIIRKYFKEKQRDPKYEGFFLILDAFIDIKKENPDFQSFNKHINDLIKIYKNEKENIEKELYDSNCNNISELKTINNFIIYKSLALKFINVACLEQKKEHIHLKIKNGETEEKVIQNYKNLIESWKRDNLQAIKNFNDLIMYKSIEKLSSNEYKMAEKILFHIVDPPKEIEPTTIDNYIKDKKIYSYSKYLIFLFEIKDNKYKIKYSKSISLPKYDGNKNNFFLYGIIYKEDLEYIGLVKNPIDEKNWKKFGGKSIENINLSNECAYERPNPVILIYKKID